MRKLFGEYFVGRCAFAETLVYNRSLPVRIHVVPRRPEDRAR